ncbi:MAG: RNA polymerase sigma factor [Ruminococcaceae bacterium]|nr:RNA polymerase sigma factor [Oscillospiraceae bacterium]
MVTENFAAKAFEKHSDMVYRLAFARVKNKSDADDILQEVFLRYLKNGEATDAEHEKALLIRITINCTKSLFKRLNRLKTEELYETIPAPENTSFKTLEAVLKLPVKYRTAVHLHYYCGFGIEEIAEITSTKASTVKSHLFRARKLLKEELEGVEF